jgi:hypothetical protein
VEADKICSNSLDLLIAFGGHETMPHDVQPFVNGLVEKVSINGIDNIWDMVRETILQFPNTVTTNSVIAVYQEKTGHTAREVGMHQAHRPLGYTFQLCKMPDCRSAGNPGHIMGEFKDDAAKIRCTVCGWKSKWLKLENQPYIAQLHKARAPLLFFHNFPSPAGLATMFF